MAIGPKYPEDEILVVRMVTLDDAVEHCVPPKQFCAVAT
jgi:hypothetical protein